MRLVGLPLLILLSLVSWSSGDEPPDLRTRAERSGFEQTSRYDDVRHLLEALAASQSRLVFLTSFGKSEEGRELPLAVLGSPAPRDPASARASRKARVLLLACPDRV